MTEDQVPDGVSRRRRHPRQRHPRRRLRLVILIVGGAVVLGAAWIAVTGLLARNELNHVRAEVHQLRAQISANDFTGASVTSAALSRRAHRAHLLTTGPAWAVAGALPYVGDPIEVTRGITASVDDLGDNVLPPLLTAGRRLDPASLRHPDGSVDLTELTAAAPALGTATTELESAANAIESLPQQTWLPAVNSVRTDLETQLVSLSHSVRSADQAARIVPGMLGDQGPKRYFVAFQNESEARGTGGLPGAFAILQADHGTVTFTRFESDSALVGVSADVDFGPAYDQLYAGAGTTTLYGNGNLSPNFPYAAQIWTSMWQKASAQHLDGVIAVDPTALSYLLAVTGPATLADGSLVTSANIVALTQSTVYAKFGADAASNLARKQYLLDVAKGASEEILDQKAPATAMLQAVVRAAGERRVLVWSADPAVQVQLEPTVVSGAIPVTRAPYVGLSIVNDGGNKLDYYLDRALVWTRTGCGPTRQVTVTITLTNDAPASGLSSTVSGRSDRHSYPTEVGDNRLEVSYLATSGALLQSVAIEGRPATTSIGLEHGHPLYTVDLELPRGTSRTITLQLSEPQGVGRLVVLRQPLVRPLQVSLNDARCG